MKEDKKFSWDEILESTESKIQIIIKLDFSWIILLNSVAQNYPYIVNVERGEKEYQNPPPAPPSKPTKNPPSRLLTFKTLISTLNCFFNVSITLIKELFWG